METPDYEELHALKARRMRLFECRSKVLFAPKCGPSSHVLTIVKSRHIGQANLTQPNHFIAGLPQGYDTLIGEAGIRLSDCQQQRLSLARTLLRDPHILILNEATAMFDAVGELALIADCSNLLANKTFILITYRPMLVDRVLCIEDRCVQEKDRSVHLKFRTENTPMAAIGVKLRTRPGPASHLPPARSCLYLHP
jgi:hypothetical protein